MSNLKFCNTLNRNYGLFQRLAFVFKPSGIVIGRSISISHLVWTPWNPFHKARSIFNYIFGRNFNRLNKPFVEQKLTQANNELVQPILNSKLNRLLASERVQILRYYCNKNPFFNKINRHVLNRTGFAFAFIGICVKNENGAPDLLKSSLVSKDLQLNRLFKNIQKKMFDLNELRESVDKSEKIEFQEFISKGCCGAVHKGKILNQSKSEEVAVKMLFNFDNLIESNSMAILNSMFKECIPYNGKFGSIDFKPCKTLPPHPNIVKVLSVFVDNFKMLKESQELYPQALPRDHGGFGRNRTLFIVQKLYNMSLKNYLAYNPHPKQQLSLAILTQCFEALDFLNQNKISHRDLKLDNILVTLPERDCDIPWIVLTDFGLCTTNLLVPFQSDEICRGGNRALMAPEIVTASPSEKSFLDYRKSDLWAMATIAYEIFGYDNPFYRKTSNSIKLDSANYKECDLPKFPSFCQFLSNLIYNILQRDPYERPSCSFASDLCHLLLQLGSEKIQCFLSITDLKLRTQVIKKWFKSNSYRVLYEMINPKTNPTNSFKLEIMFHSKFNNKRIEETFNMLDRDFNHLIRQ